MADSGFSIFPITEVKNLRFQHSQAELHCHPHHQAFILTQGGGIHRIDGQEQRVQAPWAMVVSQGKMHLYFPTADAVGWGLGFTDEFLPPSNAWMLSKAFEMSNIPLSRPETVACLDSLCRVMHGLGGIQSAANRSVAHHLLAATLHLLLRELEQQQRPALALHSPSHHLVQRFVRLMDDRYDAGQEVGHFARALGCTPRRLAAACQEVLGRAPSELLEARRMIEAKRRLADGDETVQQIALDLGYEDPSYFTRAFRRVVGETPTAYRALRGGRSLDLAERLRQRAEESRSETEKSQGHASAPEF